MRYITLLRILPVVITFLATAAHAGRPVEVPEPLEPWVDWVLHEQPQAECPFLYNAPERRCAWPGRLQLELTDSQGQFTQHWQLYAESWVPLPGNRKRWPQAVTVNGEPGLVSFNRERPALRLPAGNYRVAGRFDWASLPETLPIPPDSGLVSLSVGGKAVPFPDVEEDGQLWLRQRVAAAGGRDGDSLEVRVFRRIIDGNPLQVITRLELEVSGTQREVILGRALLEGFIPLQIGSRIPARLESDGRLRVQVRPGRWTLDVTSRSPAYVTALSRLPEGGEWPEEEVWVFAAQTGLRLVEVEGVPVVDPRQTRLPADWQDLPAYRVLPADTMRFKVIRRGDPEPEPDQLSLSRTLWLDFDGKGYTLQDRITGSMTSGWRLDVQPELALGQVVVSGEPRLITRLPDSDRSGIEVRRGAIDLTADSRYEESVTDLPAVGWEHDFQSLTATLRLPPGWKLLTASGVDTVSTTWFQRWTLLDLFLVLIAALAVMRLWGWPWGVLALLTLGLIWHEPAAPRFVWLNILAAVALLRVLPAGRFQRTVVWYRNLSLLGLVVIAVPFLVQEVRTGIYPQLEHPYQQVVPAKHFPADALGPRESAGMMKPAAPSMSFSKLAETEELAAEMDDRGFAFFAETDPDALVQTGPGLPAWEWSSVALIWNGPVERGQRIHLTLLSPGVNLVLNLLRVLLVCALAVRLLAWQRGRGIDWPSSLGGATAGLLLLVPVLALGPSDAAAEFPDAALLEELETRLLAPPECLPACARIDQLRLALTGEALQAGMEVHVLENTAIPLPASAQQWLPAEVLVDGVPAVALFRTPAGALWLELPAGRHRVMLSGPLPPRTTFQLPLPLRPGRVTFEATAWVVEGLHEDGVAAGQLQFTRVRDASAGQAASVLEPGTLPSFVQVERTLRLGLDWGVDTHVRRLSPRGSAIVLEVPLLEGEAVTTEGVRVQDGKVLVNLGPGQEAAAWHSNLAQRPGLTLRAAETDSWSEVWRAEISPVWHVVASGIDVTHHQDRNRTWLPEWRPWPGEEIRLTVTRPQAIAGPTLTIDRSVLDVSPGIRATDVVHRLNLRSSQGGQHTLTLPEGARLQSVTIDHAAQPIRQEGRGVTLPIAPGAQQVVLTWRQPVGLQNYFSTPRVDLGVPVVNSTTTVQLGENRWLLWTGGPRLGPAVLFWVVILVITLVSWGLARTRLTPLGMRHWFLLGIGLSQSEIWLGMVVVGWLLAMGLRARMDVERYRQLFNAVQIGLVALTVGALVLLYSAVSQGLLGLPEMQVAGNQSYAYLLNWYQDRVEQLTPRAWVLSVPLLVYRFLMLAWALWLALALLRWLKWGWTGFTSGGLWREVRLRRSRKGGAQTDEKPA